MLLDYEFGVIITECDAMFSHVAHKWRYGFLWSKKGSCRGITQKEMDEIDRLRLIKHHKHRMFLSRWWTTPETMVFICDAHTTGCKEQWRVDRKLWVDGLLGRN